MSNEPYASNAVRRLRFGTAITAILALIAVSGCATLNEGFVEHRQWVPAESAEGRESPATAGYWQRYFKKDDSNPLDENDTLTIRLEHGFICDFTEFASLQEYPRAALAEVFSRKDLCGNGRKLTSQGRQFVRGEITILAKAVERTTQINFGDVNLKEGGRVVYYSDDVRESGQILNFANLPLYGPKTYTGAPFYLELVVLELDTEKDGQTRALLKQLASLGGTAFPPASAVLGVLDKLGGALLNGDSDDREFRYQMEFDPVSAAVDDTSKGVYGLPLQPGVYGFVRQEFRGKDAPWGDYEVDPALGYIMDCSTKAEQVSRCTPLRERTWFTLRVTKNENATAQDAGQLFAEFQGSLKATTAADTQAMEDALDGLKNEITKSTTLDELRSQVQAVLGAAPDDATFVTERLAVDLCDALAKQQLTDARLNYLANLLRDGNEALAAVDYAKIQTECANGASALKDVILKSLRT